MRNNVSTPPHPIHETIGFGSFDRILLSLLLPLPRRLLACILPPLLLLMPRVKLLFRMGFLLRFWQCRGSIGEVGERLTADAIGITVTVIVVQCELVLGGGA